MRSRLGLKKPDGPIQGTLADQDILYEALEKQDSFRHDENARWNTYYIFKQWMEEVADFYVTNPQDKYLEDCSMKSEMMVDTIRVEVYIIEIPRG